MNAESRGARQDPGRYTFRMPTRVLCLLLAVVVLWSGLGTFEPLRPVAPSLADQRVAYDSAAALDEGSGDDHHLDVLPLEALGDATTETPGLLLARLEARVPALAMGRGPAFTVNVIGAPFHAGLLRPPCDACLTA